MIQIVWRLKPYLERNAITPHKLALEAGISPPNLYTLMRGEGAKNVSRATLAKLIGALTRLTGQPVTPNDLLEIIDTPAPAQMDSETKNWLDASAADALEYLETLEQDEPPEQVAAWLEAFQSAGTPVKFNQKTRTFKGQQ